MNHYYFNLKLKYKDLHIYLLHDVAGLKKKRNFAGRVKCCGKKDRTVVAYGYRKTKWLICGMEGENVVAYGHLSSPAL